MNIEFKGHSFDIEANVELRDAPDQSVVEITLIEWREINVTELMLDILTSNDIVELEEKIITYENDIR